MIKSPSPEYCVFGVFLILFFQLTYKNRQYWSDGSETRLTRRKLLKTAAGIGVDYSVYNPLPALGGTHLAVLLNDANTVTTINSVLVVNYPAAVVLSPVTSNAGAGGGGNGIGSIRNYTNSPAYSPSVVVLTASNTTSKNYDNYVFIGASVLGGIMLLGIGGSGLYYLKKKKEYMKRIQKKQQEDMEIVIKPTVTPIKRKTSVFSVRQNTVIPGNDNDDDSKSQCDGDDESIHPRVLQKPLPVDEYNLWGDIESTFEKNNNNPALFEEDLCDSPESTGSPPVVFSETNPLHAQNNNSPAPGQKKRMVRGNNRSLLGKVNQRFKPSKVVPDVEVLETVPEVVAENVASVAAKFETLNIGPRKSKLFLDTAIRPSSAQIIVKSPRPKSISPKALESSNTPNASQKLLMQRSSKRFDRATFNEFDTNDSSALSPSASQRNQEPDEAPPRPSTAVQRMPSAKLQSPTKKAPAHSILSAMFGSLSSPRSETMSTRTPRHDDDGASPASLTPRSDSPLPSQQEDGQPDVFIQSQKMKNVRAFLNRKQEVVFASPASVVPRSDSPLPSQQEDGQPDVFIQSQKMKNVRAFLNRKQEVVFASPASVVPRSDSPLLSQQEDGQPDVDGRPLSAKPQPSLSQARPTSTLASIFGSSSPRQDSAPASENENPLSETERPISAVQRVPSAKLRSPTTPSKSNTFLASLFGSSSPRQDSAPASENENPLSETERPISAVQRVPSAKLRSPSPARPISTLASIFGSFSPRQDSAPASENENPPLDSVSPDQMLTDSQESQLPVEPQSDLPNNTFNAPPRHFKVEALVIPAKVEGLALGRRPSSLLSSRSNQKSTVGQQIDDNEGEDMSFDTAISSTAQQPAPVQSSMQLLSKLFGGGDDDNGDDDHINDHEPIPTPFSPSAMSAPMSPQTPIWLAASNQDALVPGRMEGLELGPRRSPLNSPHPNHRQKVTNETMTRLPMNDSEDSNKNIDNQDSRQSPMPYVPTILSNRSTPPSTSKPSTSATQRTTVSRQRRAPSATTTEAVSTAAATVALQTHSKRAGGGGGGGGGAAETRRVPAAAASSSAAAVPIRPTQRSSIFATMATTNNETAPTLRARTTRAGGGGGAAVAAAPAARESDNAASDMPKSRVSKRRPV